MLNETLNPQEYLKEKLINLYEYKPGDLLSFSINDHNYEYFSLEKTTKFIDEYNKNNNSNKVTYDIIQSSKIL
jgi:hypothetical protein